jgi:hypothetical protein
MVTAEHEALHKIFQHDTELFARTMRHVFAVQVPVPRHVSITNTDFTEVRPHLRRGDSVLLAELLVEDPDNRYVMIIESQTDPDDEKAYRWPYYVAYLHDKYQCPVVLLVVCSKAVTAEWAREPILVGLPGLLCMTVRAIVLGPDNVPAITDLAMARDDVGFAVFSALTHSRSERVGVILETLAAALGTIDAETASLLAEFTEAGLGSTDGVTIWRGLMATQTYPYVSHLRSQGREEGRQEGLAEGRAADIVRLLDKRGIEMAPADRERILACRDAETLDVWLDRVLTIARISELFAA